MCKESTELSDKLRGATLKFPLDATEHRESFGLTLQRAGKFSPHTLYDWSEAEFEPTTL